MTRAEVRQAIANAANTVEGISCTPYFRQATKPGEAMVRYDHTDYPDKFGGWITWQVAVMLPSDFAAAEVYVDDVIPALVEALSEQLIISRVTPAQLNVGTGTIPAVLVSGTREE